MPVLADPAQTCARQAVTNGRRLGGGLDLLAALVARLPQRWLGALGAFVGWLAGNVFRYRRAHVERAMEQAGIPGSPGRVRSLYKELGISLLEVVSLGASEEAVERVILDAPSARLWDEARAMGRGVVIAGTHTGNWDLAACAMAARCDLLVVTKRLSVPWLDRFWQSTRARRGVRFAQAQGAFAAARRTLASGGAVVLMIDQVPLRRRHGIEVEFLGRPALVDRSAAALAAASGAPLVVAAARRDESGQQVLHVLQLLVPQGTAGRSWIDSTTAAATGALDRFVRAYPDQWLWLHRRWAAPRPARASG